MKATLSLPRIQIVDLSNSRLRPWLPAQQSQNRNRRELRLVLNVLCILSVAILAVILQFLPGFETDGLTRGYGHLFAGAGISPDAPFAGLDDENAKTAQLDPIAARERVLHRIEERFDCLFGFQLRYAGLVGKPINDIEFDHGIWPPALANIR
jgi:hypothetical protein